MTINQTLLIMGQPLEAILEKDGRLRLLNVNELKGSTVGQSVTIRIVGIDEVSEERAELMGYTLLSQPVLAKLWEDEPDIEEVWGDL